MEGQGVGIPRLPLDAETEIGLGRVDAAIRPERGDGIDPVGAAGRLAGGEGRGDDDDERYAKRNVSGSSVPTANPGGWSWSGWPEGRSWRSPLSPRAPRLAHLPIDIRHGEP